MEQPLITIITVTYNAVNNIERTLKSIIDQPNRSDFEYIVIDGSSSDGTQAVVEAHLDNIDVWLSEPDKGIPDALNKGVKLASGKYILFVLAGDTLLNLPYQQLAVQDADLVCFPVSVTGDVVQKPVISNMLKIKNTIPHQGAFFKRTEHLVHDNKYRFFCDFALCQVYYKNKLNMKAYGGPAIAFHGLDGATSNKKNFHEVFSAIDENYGPFYRLIAIIYWKYDGLLRRLNLRKG